MWICELCARQISLHFIRATALLWLPLQTLHGGGLAADADIGAHRIAAAAAGTGPALIRPAQARRLKVAIVLHVGLGILWRGRALFRHPHRGCDRGKCDEKRNEPSPFKRVLQPACAHGIALLPHHTGTLGHLTGGCKTAEAPGALKTFGGAKGAADAAHAQRQGRMHHALAGLLRTGAGGFQAHKTEPAARIRARCLRSRSVLRRRGIREGAHQYQLDERVSAKFE
jgi:hypothetical protein